MRLTSQQIQRLASEIVDRLESDGLIRLGDRAAVVEGVRGCIEEDLMVEDRLEEEVHGILRRYADLMRAQDITYEDMFRKVKRELVQQRKVIL